MAEEVSLSSSRMSAADLAAIATYLKDQPGLDDVTSTLSPNDPAFAAGGAIYRDVCSACHAIDGRGVPNLYPALADLSLLRSKDPTSAIRILLRGARSVSTAQEPTAPAMPAYGWQLSDQQAAAVLTYARNAWGVSAPPVTDDEVKRARTSLAWRSD